MKIEKLFVVLLCNLVLFSSCSKEDDILEPVPSTAAYEKGMFVLNEGSAGQGSVTFVSKNFSTIIQDAYTASNPNDLMGKFAQNIFFNNENAYIISGGSNVINVVNRRTFKLISKIESEFAAPRYGVVKDGKAYVTNANDYNSNVDDYVSVINLTTNKVEAKIELNGTANRIIEVDGKLYISEPYKSDKLIVVNIVTNKLETPINIGVNGDTMEVKDGILYILQGGYPGKMSKVKLADNSISTIDLPTELDGAKNLDVDQDKMYYTVNSSVYSMSLSATAPSTTPLFTYESTSQYGKAYGFSVNNNLIYIADGGDFKSNSKAYVYSLSGILQKELNVGVGPNGFYFNN
jgi:hypothetical protein